MLNRLYKKMLALLAILGLAFNCYAQEIITDLVIMDKEGKAIQNTEALTVLNEELRKDDVDIDTNATAITTLSTTVTGKFNTSTGHDHDGTDSKLIPYNCRIVTGTYTGDGNATKAITGIGFTPKVIRAGRKAGATTTPWADNYINDQMDVGYCVFRNYNSDGSGIYASGQGFVSIDSGGFTVAVNADAAKSLNTTSVVYWYEVLG